MKKKVQAKNRLGESAIDTAKHQKYRLKQVVPDFGNFQYENMRSFVALFLALEEIVRLAEYGVGEYTIPSLLKATRRMTGITQAQLYHYINVMGWYNIFIFYPGLGRRIQGTFERGAKHPRELMRDEKWVKRQQARGVPGGMEDVLAYFANLSANRFSVRRTHNREDLKEELRSKLALIQQCREQALKTGSEVEKQQWRNFDRQFEKIAGTPERPKTQLGSATFQDISQEEFADRAFEEENRIEPDEEGYEPYVPD